MGAVRVSYDSSRAQLCIWTQQYAETSGRPRL